MKPKKVVDLSKTVKDSYCLTHLKVYALIENFLDANRLVNSTRDCILGYEVYAWMFIAGKISRKKFLEMLMTALSNDDEDDDRVKRDNLSFYNLISELEKIR